MPATLSTLVEALRFWGGVQSSEGLADPSDFQKIIQEAARLHNPMYVATETVFTIPEAEITAINYLALLKLSEWRMVRQAMATTMRNGDFQTTRDTPFEKNEKLAKHWRELYSTECQRLGISSFAGARSISVTEMVAANPETGEMVPHEISNEPPVVNLDVPAVPVSGVTVLSFSTSAFSNFAIRYVFYITGSEPIYQPWNVPSIVLPRINDAAEKLITATNQRQNSFKVQNLSMVSGSTHRFLIVTETRSGIFGYSNEVTVAIP